MNKSFAIKIDQKVLDYMNKKRKSVLTLNISTTGGGCCPTFEISEVTLAKPDHPDLFDIYQQNAVTLYISKKTKVTASMLHFTFKKNLIGATILVEGISLKKRD